MNRQPSYDETEAFIGGLSDEVLAECVRSVLETVPGLREPGRRMFLRLDPRKSPRLKEWVFKAFGSDRPAKPVQHHNLASDFEVD